MGLAVTSKRVIGARKLWAAEPLYIFLDEALPAYRSPKLLLNIPGIARAIGNSPESVFRWFRRGYLTLRVIKKLMPLLESPENQALLEKQGKIAPTEQDLYRFLSR
jgi:hypothetical protein